MNILRGFVRLPLAKEVWLSIGVMLLCSMLVYAVCWTHAKRFLHILQLDSYQLDGYRRSLQRNGKSDVKPLVRLWWAGALVEAAVFSITVYPASEMPWVSLFLIVGELIFFAVAIGHGICRQRVPQKKPFAATQRMKRLQTAYRVLSACVCVLAAALANVVHVAIVTLIPVDRARMVVVAAVLISAVVAYLPIWLTPYLVELAAKLRERPEKKINDGFIADARRIRKERQDLIVIGITGSYGKTSTKFILGTILQERFSVLVPPASYNTPMGVTRVIREMLKPEHQVLICEMGARRVGEIQELCDIAYPRYGILTSIGSQHLETFGSLANIAKTKYELMQALPEDGIGFFPADGGECEKLYRAHEKEKRLFASPDGYMYAEDVELSAKGTTFTLCCADGGRAWCQARLLGAHNIVNILGCAAVARALGMEMEEIARGIAKAEPVEHRLQLIDSGNGVVVIDDAFNSNPAGTQAAMQVLSMFEGYRKICVTPGLVELGEAEIQENKKFGVRMAQVCDIVILVGKNHTLPIQEGLLEAGFAQDNMKVVANLEEATAVLGTLTRVGDVVLFENDLPDNYEG